MRLCFLTVLFFMLTACNTTYITKVQEAENGLKVTHKRNYEKQQQLIEAYALDKCGNTGFTKSTQRKEETKTYTSYETVPDGESVYRGRVNRYGRGRSTDVDVVERRTKTVPVEREYTIDWYETTCVCKDKKTWLMPQEQKHVQTFKTGCLGKAKNINSCRKLIDIIFSVYGGYYLDIPQDEVDLLVKAFNQGCSIDVSFCKDLRTFKEALESENTKLKGLEE